jgi:hypothetical protein
MSLILLACLSCLVLLEKPDPVLWILLQEGEHIISRKEKSESHGRYKPREGTLTRSRAIWSWLSC